MTVQIPDTYAGTGGGLLGSIKAHIMADVSLFEAIGDRIQPGRQQRGQKLPFVVTSHVQDTVDSMVTFDSGEGNEGEPKSYDVWAAKIQVSIFFDSYEGARLLGMRVNQAISRRTMSVDNYCVSLIPLSRTCTIDPERSEKGKDVWQWAYRYQAQIAETVYPDNFISLD